MHNMGSIFDEWKDVIGKELRSQRPMVHALKIRGFQARAEREGQEKALVYYAPI